MLQTTNDALTMLKASSEDLKSLVASCELAFQSSKGALEVDVANEVHKILCGAQAIVIYGNLLATTSTKGVARLLIESVAKHLISIDEITKATATYVDAATKDAMASIAAVKERVLEIKDLGSKILEIENGKN